jgi:hypothetical protein
VQQHYPEARRIISGELHLPINSQRTSKMNSRHLLLLICLFTGGVLAGCSGTKPAVAERAPVLYQPTPQATPAQAASTEAPKIADVEAAVQRVFKGAAVVDPDYKSRFLVGDFNGDTSQDLAVVLRPVPEKIADMNERPFWLLRDPRVPYNPRVPLHIDKDDVLLAVIHGYGANNWRDPDATQTFLLKNVVGADMRVQDGKEFVKNNPGPRRPRPQGDLIGEKLKGSDGYLYYNAANYLWYDPKTFKAEPEAPGPFHRGRRTQ